MVSRNVLSHMSSCQVSVSNSAGKTVTLSKAVPGTVRGLTIQNQLNSSLDKNHAWYENPWVSLAGWVSLSVLLLIGIPTVVIFVCRSKKKSQHIVINNDVGASGKMRNDEVGLYESMSDISSQHKPPDRDIESLSVCSTTEAHLETDGPQSSIHVPNNLPNMCHEQPASTNKPNVLDELVTNTPLQPTCSSSLSSLAHSDFGQPSGDQKFQPLNEVVV